VCALAVRALCITNGKLAPACRQASSHTRWAKEPYAERRPGWFLSAQTGPLALICKARRGHASSPGSQSVRAGHVCADCCRYGRPTMTNEANGGLITAGPSTEDLRTGASGQMPSGINPASWGADRIVGYPALLPSANGTWKLLGEIGLPNNQIGQ
jgi:hypothetical protein